MRDKNLLYHLVHLKQENGTTPLHMSLSTTTTMKQRLRNGFYFVLFLLTVICFKTVHHLNDDENVSDAESKREHFRFKRNILEIVDRKFLPISQEGPILDFGHGPEKFGKDVFITIKTTLKYHNSRVTDIIDTWFKLAPEHVSTQPFMLMRLPCCL